MNAHATEPRSDTLVTSSNEAAAVATALKETGDAELASLWERYAAFLLASEAYVGVKEP